MIETILEALQSLSEWHIKIVYYADKRFDGSRFVRLNERCAILCDRYPMKQSIIMAAFVKIRELELEIKQLIGMDLED